MSVSGNQCVDIWEVMNLIWLRLMLGTTISEPGGALVNSVVASKVNPSRVPAVTSLAAFTANVHSNATTGR